MNRFFAWVKEYPWIVLVAMGCFVVFMFIIRRGDALEERVNRTQMAVMTLTTAQELAKQTATRDSLFAVGDSLRLHNQYLMLANQKIIEAKLDSILKELR